MTKKAKSAKQAVSTTRKTQVFPRGWNEKRVKDVIAFYDAQTDDEAVAEYETAMELEGLTMILVPNKLVPEVRELIGQHV